MSRRAVALLLTVAFAPLAWCVAVGAIIGGDPMLAVEITGMATAALWAGFFTRQLVRSQQMSRALAADASDTTLFGVPIRITRALGGDAVVVGALRPVIFVGSELVERFSADEVEAVVLHEDHHRRTRAPLRAAALEAWLRLFGRSSVLRGVLMERLDDLETMADADAMRRGTSPRSLARALLKGEMSLRPASFAYAGQRRVERLLDEAAGTSRPAPGRLPYEWLPIAVLAIGTVGCHLGL